MFLYFTDIFMKKISIGPIIKKTLKAQNILILAYTFIYAPICDDKQRKKINIEFMRLVVVIVDTMKEEISIFSSQHTNILQT